VKIWYTPTGASGTTEVDLGNVQERAGPRVVVRQAPVEGLTGAVVTTHFGGRIQVRYRFEWDLRSGYELRRDVFALLNHLQRGGFCLVAEEPTKAWAAFVGKLPEPGDERLFVGGGSVFETLAPSISLTAREVMVQSDCDTAIYEMALVSAHTAGAPFIDLDPGVLCDYQDAAWALIREVGSYPAMRLPVAERNGDYLTQAGAVWTLDLPLEEDPDVLALLADVDVPPGPDIDVVIGGLDPSLEDQLDIEIGGTTPINLGGAVGSGGRGWL